MRRGPRAVTTREVDHGANALIARMKQISRESVLKVGILARGSEDKQIREDDGHVTTSGTTVEEVATAHEFGVEGLIPERSFIRGWYDENRDKNLEAFRRLLAKVLRGELTYAQMWNQLGLWMVGKIQNRIVAGIEPALNQSTIDRKGSSTPLIDTGQLKASITYEIE
jgi:hypothetical protein